MLSVSLNKTFPSFLLKTHKLDVGCPSSLGPPGLQPILPICKSSHGCKIDVFYLQPSPLFQKIEASTISELKARFAGKQNPEPEKKVNYLYVNGLVVRTFTCIAAESLFLFYFYLFFFFFFFFLTVNMVNCLYREFIFIFIYLLLYFFFVYYLLLFF